MSIAAIDAGNRYTKYFDTRLTCPIRFPSAIGINDLDRNLKGRQEEFDFEWQYEGLSGFAGSLALRESEYVESRKDDSKAHFDARLRTLIALHQNAIGNEHSIIVGQPIDTHSEEEKNKIKSMYTSKRHDLTVNGKRKIIIIRHCEVAPEGAASGLLVAPERGVIRVIDIGSSSINFATIRDLDFNNKGSGTFFEGMETKKVMQPASFARQIASKAVGLLKWSPQDAVFITGGGAEELFMYLQEFFPGLQMIKDPFTSNVRAFLRIARKLYGETKAY